MALSQRSSDETLFADMLAHVQGTSLAELMDIADEQNYKSCLVFLAELRATTISAYNTINSAEKELQNRGGCQSNEN